MVTYLPRSAWRARPPNGGPGNLTPSRVEGAVIHWPGMAKPITTEAGVASALRGWQNFHMDVRGWSDIAYQVAVDQAGRAWTLRGLRTQSGANGNNDLNERYGAILLVLAPGEALSAALIATVRGVIADFRGIYGADADAIRPHSAVRPDGTDCPGPAARAAIARGAFEPGTPPPPTDWFDMATPEELKQVVGDVVDQKFRDLYNLAANGTAAKNHAAVMKAIGDVPQGVMEVQLPDMLAPAPAAGEVRPKMAVSSHLTHMPTRVVDAVAKAEAEEL